MTSGAGGKRPAGLPVALREALGRESAPVRPLYPASYRAAVIGVIVSLTGIAYLTSVGLRADAVTLGSWPVWAPAVARIVAASWLLGLAFRDAVPGARTRRTARRIALIGAPVLLVVLAELLAHAAGSPAAPPGSLRAGMLGCFPRELAIAVPAAIGLLWLLSRSYVMHPVFVAVGGALGVGLIADAALHLTCAATGLAHLVLAHGGAVFALAALGAVLGLVAGRVRVTDSGVSANTRTGR